MRTKSRTRYRLQLASLAALLLSISSACFAQLGGSSLERLAGNTRPTPLSLEEAFPYYVSQTDDGGLQITWTPARGHYLYRHAFAFSVLAEADSGIGSEAAVLASDLEFTIPPGLPRSDQFFGDIEAYYDDITAIVSLPTPLASSLPDAAVLLIEFQGCADWGFCYPPQRASYSLVSADQESSNTNSQP